MKYARNNHDWYVEPKWCVEQLADEEDFEGSIWDPACGQGTIPEVFRNRGRLVYASDIEDRGYPCTITRDFFSINPSAIPPILKGETHHNIITNPPYGNIITNPPYGRGKLAKEFIEHALKFNVYKVAMLVNCKFLYSQGRYSFFTKEARPDRIWHCSERPSCPPGGMGIEAKGGAVDYCWLVYELPGTGWVPKVTETRWLKPRKLELT